jgi:anti-anti-sigma factor
VGTALLIFIRLLLPLPGGLCNRDSVDQDGVDPAFAAVGVPAGDRVVVTVTGEIDMSTADTLFDVATRDGTPAATIDLRAVTFFDSAGIHALLRIAEHYRGNLLVLPSPAVQRTLEITGLSTQPWLGSH